MASTSAVIFLFGSFVLLALLGVPIAVCLCISGFGTATLLGITPIAVVQNIFSMLNSYTLLAVPLFLIVGNVMEYGGITERLVAFARTLVGHMRGGLAQVNILTNMLMAGISGSATADATALGSVMLPAMKREGYPADLSCAINAAASTIGPVIPPSIMMVVYGAYSGVSIGAMFAGGFLPGVCIGVSLMLYVYIWAKRNNFRTAERRATLREVGSATLHAIPALLAPVIIVVGIVGGIVTTTEAGMLCAVYCILVSIFLFRSINRKNLLEIIENTLTGMSKPLLCVAGAGAFGYMMAYLNVQKMFLTLLGDAANSRVFVTLFIVVLYLILGTFMDATPAIVIFMSIIQSLSSNVGLNPLHVGVLICVTMCFGFITPPYGLTLLISAGIGGVPTITVIRRLKWIFVLLIAVILLIAFVPGIVLLVPRLLGMSV